MCAINGQDNVRLLVVEDELVLAKEAPQSIEALGRISGVGAKKLEAYGEDIVRVLAGG